MKRKPLIIANWKMHTSLADATVLAGAVRNGLEHIADVEVVLCPPFVWLCPLVEFLSPRPKELKFGAQDMFFEDVGNFTGEISPVMLKKICDYVIIGHSERRQLFSEENEIIDDKVHAALRHKITPIVVVGEIAKSGNRSRGRPTKIEAQGNIFRQLKKGLDGLNDAAASKIIVAYEPVWAIGTGEPATGAYANQIIFEIRRWLQQKFSLAASESVRILYGGSVTSQNIAEFINQPDIDGVLVGGASLKANEFLKICREAAGKYK